MDRKDHLSGLRSVSQRLILIPKPDELVLSVALADIDAELDQRLVDNIPEGVGLRGIGGALDRDGTLVVGVAGGTPAAVFLLNVKADAAILVDTIVAGRLRGGLGKPTAQPLRCALANNTVRRDPVNTVSALP